MRPHGSPTHLEQRRLRAVALNKPGVGPVEIAHRLNATQRSVQRWLQAWAKVGRDALASKPTPGRLLRAVAYVSSNTGCSGDIQLSPPHGILSMVREVGHGPAPAGPFVCAGVVTRDRSANRLVGNTRGDETCDRSRHLRLLSCTGLHRPEREMNGSRMRIPGKTCRQDRTETVQETSIAM